MKLKALITYLQSKSEAQQEEEVEFLVYKKGNGALVAVEMTGPTTDELLRVLRKRGKHR